MFISIGLLVILQCHSFVFGETLNADHRIVRGSKALVGEFPYQAVLFKRNIQTCGCTIIGDQWVLTSASCCSNWEFAHEYWTIRTGSIMLGKKNEVTYNVRKAILHPKYERSYTGYDIALLKVHHIKFTDTINCLNIANHKQPTGEGVVTGFGSEIEKGHPSRVLMKTHLKILKRDHKKCRKVAAEDQFCAWDPMNWSDACDKDTGGPFVTDYRQGKLLIGVVSWGHGCGQPESPAFYTSVGFHNKWIFKTVKDDYERHCRSMGRTTRCESDPRLCHAPI